MSHIVGMQDETTDRLGTNQRELAKWLGVSTATIRRWEKAGTIQASYRKGGMVRYDKEDVFRQLHKLNTVK